LRGQRRVDLERGRRESEKMECVWQNCDCVWARVWNVHPKVAVVARLQAASARLGDVVADL
jgi:hypothetical protein